MANCFGKSVSFRKLKTGSGGGRRGDGGSGRHYYRKAGQSVGTLGDTGMPPGDKSPSQSGQTQPSPPRALRVA